MEKSKKSKSGNRKSYSLIKDLDLYPKGQTSLKDFFDQYSATRSPEIILIIIYYLERVLKVTSINENTIFTCYRHLDLPHPNIRKAIGNISTRKGWLDTTSFSDLKLAVSGVNYFEHSLKQKADGAE